MKTRLLTFTVITLLGCTMTSTPEPNGKVSNLARPQTEVEGIWNWVQTTGEGIAGPYKQDPETEGFSMRYDFIDNSNLIVYRNDSVYGRYAYTFTPRTDNGDGTFTNGELRLTDVNNPKSNELLFWDIQTDGNQTRLFVLNYQPWYMGTDNQYKQEFLLIKRHSVLGL